MVKRAIQEQIQDILRRTERLNYEVERGLRDAKDEEQRVNYLHSMTEEFTAFSSLAEELVNEVKSNLSKGLRPAEELTYVENLESFLDYVKYIYPLVEGQEWEDNVLLRSQISQYPAYSGDNNSRLSETGRLFVSVLIDQVRTCCYDFYEECVTIADLISTSFYVQKYPEKYPTIVSCIPKKKPTEVTVSTNESSPAVPSLEEPPVFQSKVKDVEDIADQSHETEKDADLNVKILTAYQSGLLTGEFHKLPSEKQYAVLAVLLNRSKANIKNALTALYGNANTNKNPLNLPSVIEKVNDLINEKDLGIPLVKNRKEL